MSDRELANLVTTVKEGAILIGILILWLGLDRITG